MRGRASAVDDSLTMTSTVHSGDRLEQLLAATTGRFGRPLRTIPCTDPELAPTRRETVIRMRARMRDGEYRVDPLAVSGVIVDRVFAGRVTTPLQRAA